MRQFIANMLSSLRLSPLFLKLVLAITILYAAALSFDVVNILPIGSDKGIFSGLFISSSLPIKPKRLSKAEKEAFFLFPPSSIAGRGRKSC